MACQGPRRSLGRDLKKDAPVLQGGRVRDAAAIPSGIDRASCSRDSEKNGRIHLDARGVRSRPTRSLDTLAESGEVTAEVRTPTMLGRTSDR